jgi:hypothetical protein
MALEYGMTDGHDTLSGDAGAKAVTVVVPPRIR